ncbi:NPP1 family protein [Nonomuraea sp. NPDC004297]
MTDTYRSASSPAAPGRRTLAVLGASALALSLLAAPANAYADPLQPTVRLPAALTPVGTVPVPDRKWQPALDFDTDSCYNVPAIWANGKINPGLPVNAGTLTSDCRNRNRLGATNVYSRAKCNNGWCAYMYAYYFQKDMSANPVYNPLTGLTNGSGHRHDWEHIIVWVHEQKAHYVSVSQHTGYELHIAPELPWMASHPKIVYHKDGPSTHAFRFAKLGGGDEPPENHQGRWQLGRLIGWKNYPAGTRAKLVGADFGAATFKLVNGRFADALAKAKPAAIPFDPRA